jgi:hypothetical protein
MVSRPRPALLACVLAATVAAAACGGSDDGDDGDGDGPDDAAIGDGAGSDGLPPDAAVEDAATVDAPVVDARPLDAMVDAPPITDHHVHIQVSNTCVMTVTPLEITVPPNQTAYLDWHNHSVDYPVDVWMSYGGGFVDLPTGATWNEPVGHCGTPSVHTEYADISTACSSFRFLIRCN